jgi:hypothetical protein
MASVDSARVRGDPTNGAPGQSATGVLQRDDDCDRGDRHGDDGEHDKPSLHANVPPRTTAVRYWDLAGTEPSPANRDPDYTVGIRLEHDPKTGTFYLTGIVPSASTSAVISSACAARASAYWRFASRCRAPRKGARSWERRGSETACISQKSPPAPPA